MTTDEMIAELQSVCATEDPENAYTTEEWCDMLGLGAKAVRWRLRLAKKAGRLEVLKVKRMDLGDTQQSVNAYRLI